MSKLVEWSDELSVGIQEIDEQHKMLVDLLNQLHEAIHKRHGSEATRKILDELADYTRIHFAVEESLMRVLEYPDYEAHKHEHENLIQQMVDLKQKLDTGTHSISFELLHFLKVWLTKHILESDREYSPHFLSKGVNASWQKKSWVGKLWGSLTH